MNQPKEHKSRSHARFRGFYTALGISLVMIAAACVFAYRQTSDTLEENLSSLTEQLESPTAPLHTDEAVIGIQTDVAMETTPVTQTPTEASAEAAPQQTEETTEEATIPEEIASHQIVPPLSDCQILQPFSGDELVKSETTGTWQTHNGVDLACETGTDVFAIDTGTVAEINSDPLWGYTISIDHGNGVVSKYCGMDGSVEVRAGDTVQSGQKIGVTGTAPDIESALKPHLHLEVQKSGIYLDPMEYCSG